MLPPMTTFFFTSRRRHTRCLSDWSSNVCSSDLGGANRYRLAPPRPARTIGERRRGNPAAGCRSVPVKILLTGKNGQIGWDLAHALAPLGEVIAFDRGGLDLAVPDQIVGAGRSGRPHPLPHPPAL